MHLCTYILYMQKGRLLRMHGYKGSESLLLAYAVWYLFTRCHQPNNKKEEHHSICETVIILKLYTNLNLVTSSLITICHINTIKCPCFNKCPRLCSENNVLLNCMNLCLLLQMRQLSEMGYTLTGKKEEQIFSFKSRPVLRGEAKLVAVSSESISIHLHTVYMRYFGKC